MAVFVAVVVAEASTAVVEVFTVAAAVVSAPAALADRVAGRMRRLLRGTEGRVARLRNAQVADTRRGPETAMLPDQAIISRVAISGSETPLRHPQPQRTVNGIPSAVARERRELRVVNR